MPPPAKTKTSRTKKRQTSKVRTQFRRAENPLSSLGLTARETEVLSWIAQGKTNYEIGMILSACTGTICKHVEHILAKLNVENRTAAAIVAIADWPTQKMSRSGAMMRMSRFMCQPITARPPLLYAGLPARA